MKKKIYKCESCEAEVTGSAKFCTNCGSQLEPVLDSSWASYVKKVLETLSVKADLWPRSADMNFEAFLEENKDILVKRDYRVLPVRSLDGLGGSVGLEGYEIAEIIEILGEKMKPKK